MPKLTFTKTPGVYIEEISSQGPSVSAVETAVPVFIGYTAKADKLASGDLAGVPVRVNSMQRFVSWFGLAPVQTVDVEVSEVSGKYTPVKAVVNAPSDYRMYHAVQLFFDNGGEACYVISVGRYKPDGSVSPTELGTNSSGTGGLDIARKTTGLTLVVIPDANGLAGNNDEDYYSLFNQAIVQCRELKDRFSLVDVKNRPIPLAVPNIRNAVLDERGLSFAAAYYPWLETNYAYRTDEHSVLLRWKMPGGTVSKLSVADAKTDESLKQFITRDFVSKLNSLLDQNKVLMPPSSAIAGIMAQLDSTTGVWKAPANVSIQSVLRPTIQVSDTDQGDLNIHIAGRSVNAIRNFVGRGTLVWGARTLAGNDNEWRYVSVRRLFIMIEQSLKNQFSMVVFEPNDANTWANIKSATENFLTGLWRQGALMGAKPEEAFFVKTGLGQTMTPLDVSEGRIIVEIGMAAVRPAEFIILRLFFQSKISNT